MHLSSVIPSVVIYILSSHSDGELIYYGDSSDYLSYYDAKLFCENEHNGELASFYTDEDRAAVIDIIGEGGAPWIGLFSSSSAGWWRFMNNDLQCPDLTTGACVDFWRNGHPDCIDDRYYCSIFYPTENVVDNVVDCETPGPFLCDGDVQQGRQYIAGTAGRYLSWDDADDRCQALYGTHLATILTDNDYDNAIAEISTVPQPTWNAWIGLNDRNQEGVFEWADGTVCTLNNNLCSQYWDTDNGQPDNTDDIFGHNDADCVYFGPWTGFHLEVNCNRVSAWKYLCNYPNGGVPARVERIFRMVTPKESAFGLSLGVMDHEKKDTFVVYEFISINIFLFVLVLICTVSMTYCCLRKRENSRDKMKYGLVSSDKDDDDM